MPLDLPVPGADAGTWGTKLNEALNGTGPGTLAATYAAHPPKWSDLTGTTIIAHRGGALHVPEHTMEGYRVAVGQGLRVLEPDLHVLADGSLAVVHDATVDRTATTTGNVADHTAASWKQLSLDPSTYFGGGWADGVRPPLFEEMLTEFGNRVLLMPEIKTTGQMGKVVDALERRGVDRDTVLLSSFNWADCETAVARGWDVAYLGFVVSADIANVVSAGFEWIASDHTAVTQDLVNTAHASGVKVAAWVVNRRYNRDALAAMGVDAIVSDDPLYLHTDDVRRTTDLFARQVWLPGLLANNSDRGKFYTGGYWGWDLNGGAVNFALHGYLKPPDPTNFVMDFNVRYDAFNASDLSRWASVYIGTTDFAFVDGSNASYNGYHLLMRGNGQLDIYRVAPGAGGALLGTIAHGTVADPVIGADTPFRITVTPTQITLARTDVAAQVQVTDSAARGGFITLGRHSAGLRFKGMSIT